MSFNPGVERNIILQGFRKLGFRGMVPFLNVCKTIDVTLNGLELLEFYNGSKVTESIANRLCAILEMLKYE